jgi:hypothetical protein
LNRADRQERIKALGRIAYRHLNDAEVFGIIEISGEEKHVRILEEGGLPAELIAPFRAWALPTEYSQIEIRFDGRKVLDIRWDCAGSFKAVHFEHGDWKPC